MHPRTSWHAVLSVLAGLIVTSGYFLLLREIVRTTASPAVVIAALVPAMTVLPAVIYAVNRRQ